MKRADVIAVKNIEFYLTAKLTTFAKATAETSYGVAGGLTRIKI